MWRVCGTTHLQIGAIQNGDVSTTAEYLRPRISTNRRYYYVQSHMSRHELQEGSINAQEDAPNTVFTWHFSIGWSLIVISLLDLKMTCTWVGRSVGSRGPLLGITVNSWPTSDGEPSVDSNAKLKLISNLPLFFREHACFVSSNTLRTPKSRPPSAPEMDEQQSEVA